MSRLYICGGCQEEYTVSLELGDIPLSCHKCKIELEPKFSVPSIRYKGDGFTGAQKNG